MSSRLASKVAVLLSFPALLGLACPVYAADTIYAGGPIITMAGETPQTVEAVVVRDGKILFAGAKADALKQAAADATQVDLAGKTMLPGFIDGHGHLEAVGVQAVSANLLPPPDGKNDSIEALLQTAKDWMKSSPIPAKYGIILGFGYDDSQLAEKRHPTRHDLDKISTELPVYFIHQSGHLGAANSKALELVGITAATPNPQGGVIRREPGSNEPDGVLEETAAFMALGKLLAPRAGAKEAVSLINAGEDLYMSYGYTTAQSGATTPAVVDGYMALARNNGLRLDVVSYPLRVAIGDATFMSSPFFSHQYTNHFRIAGVKLVLDGSPQGKTAWLTQPYLVPPEGQPASYVGYPAMPDEQVNGLVAEAFKNGWQVLAHVNGDAAIDQFVKAVKAAEDSQGVADRRPVAIHSQTAREDQLDAMVAEKILPSFFPMHTYYWGDWHRDSVLGNPRAQNISPTGWALKRGMTFTSHHDAPVAFPDSIRVLSSTVNRTTRTGQVLGPDQRVDPYIALKAMTSWAAYQYFEEATKGTIEPGKVADFVILSDNPLTVPREKLIDLKVLETIKDGKSIYQRKEQAGSLEETPGACAGSLNCQKAMLRSMVAMGMLHTHRWVGEKAPPLSGL
ncbi:MAG: amidohydrolase [Hyphomicrobiales bacterium]